MLFVGVVKGSGREVEFGFSHVVMVDGGVLVVTDEEGLDVCIDDQSVRLATLSAALETIDRDMGTRDLWQASYKLKNGERLEVRRDISPSQAVGFGSDSVSVKVGWCNKCKRTTAHGENPSRCLLCAGLLTETAAPI